jgi:hypothetical protein
MPRRYHGRASGTSQSLDCEPIASGQIPGFMHLYVGEEAVAVGACVALEQGDTITSTHRGHGHCIAKGGDPRLIRHTGISRVTARMDAEDVPWCGTAHPSSGGPLPCLPRHAMMGRISVEVLFRKGVHLDSKILFAIAIEEDRLVEENVMKKPAKSKVSLIARFSVLFLLCLLAITCSLPSSPSLSFPAEFEGRWYNRSLTYYTEWFNFSGSTMQYFSSYYDNTYSFTLTSMDSNRKEFSVTDGSINTDGSKNTSIYTYSIDGGNLILTADTGMIWGLNR